MVTVIEEVTVIEIKLEGLDTAMVMIIKSKVKTKDKTEVFTVAFTIKGKHKRIVRIKMTKMTV